MRRRSQFSYSTVPTMRLPRSVFPMRFSHKTTTSVGRLFPFLGMRVWPGDTLKTVAACVSRVTSSFVKPVMDNLFIDMRFFYVPDRIVWDDLPQLYGENPSAPWFDDSAVTVPAVTVPALTQADSLAMKGTLADYFGDFAAGMNYQNGTTVTQLLYRGFAKIYNDWYVSETTGTPVVYKGTALDTQPQTLNSNAWSPSNIFGKCPNAYKVHDRFTSALPAPQKGNPVTLPLTGNAPVTGTTGYSTVSSFSSSSGLTESRFPLYLYSSDVPGSQTQLTDAYTLGTTTSGTLGYQSSGTAPYDNSAYLSLMAGKSAVTGTADLSNVTAADVNELRLAFQTQRLFELSAYAGTRYVEVLNSLYGVSVYDGILQRSEYLGGSRSPISVQQVASTTAGTSGDQLADLGAYSLSYGKARFTKGFVEPGFVIGVAVIRYYHTYQQGIDPSHRLFNRLQQYNPFFVHIGMQPIYTSELYGDADPDTIFGYQFVYDEYRSQPNRISGGLRSTLPNSLDIWHFADDYANAPTLNDSFLLETPTNVDRTLTVPSATEDQFILDFGFDVKAIRPFPVFGTPKLIDHP